MGRHTGAEKAELLLEAARYLNETLELERVYDRFDELLTDAVPHGGVIVSSFDAATGVIRCDYALVDGEKLDPAILPPLELNREGGGMQSRVIVSGEPLVVNDVPEQVKDPSGVYYDVNKEGEMRKLPEEGPPGVQSAMMLPVKHEGDVVGVVQLMHEHFHYEQEHLELAEGLVGLMAAAVRNARLHRQSQAEAAARARAEATAAEREHAARVLEAVGDGIFLLDGGVVRLWNRAAELVTGRDRDGVLGRPDRGRLRRLGGARRRDPGLGRLGAGALGRRSRSSSTGASCGSRSSRCAAWPASSTPSATSRSSGSSRRRRATSSRRSRTSCARR